MLEVGMRVRVHPEGMLSDELEGLEGIIYGCDPGRPWPWQVRIDNWPVDEPGMSFAESELEPVVEGGGDQVAE